MPANNAKTEIKGGRFCGDINHIMPIAVRLPSPDPIIFAEYSLPIFFTYFIKIIPIAVAPKKKGRKSTK